MPPPKNFAETGSVLCRTQTLWDRASRNATLISIHTEGLLEEGEIMKQQAWKREKSNITHFLRQIYDS